MNVVDSLSPFRNQPLARWSPHVPHSANIFELFPLYHLEPPLDLKWPSPALSRGLPGISSTLLSHKLPSSFLKVSFPLQPPLGAAVFSPVMWKHKDVREMLWASQFIFLLSRLFLLLVLSSLRFSVADSSLATLCFFFFLWPSCRFVQVFASWLVFTFIIYAMSRAPKPPWSLQYQCSWILP